ncbi:AAA family ATPase [Marinilactibacillus piezotolerans]|uniref:AAA family ATPase n=1 Tax=Marinilactibacillus piezotolerans TaxID=258723 RepID=UPI0015C430BC|nr:SMC family ATPase [Marinilactibacillus piezotolerans]
MRPLRLTMNAFGPYKGKVEIDFTQLAQSSLFLVSGPTGAGKTTIFDAIAYALFDQASGDARQRDTFKSQFSKDTDLCYVELEFELGENRYLIHREPTQIGPGTRSKTKQIQSNIAFHHDHEVTTKVSEANKEIQQLIGLTYDQFRQIVMLPQGAFKKMLESDSGEKEKIFRNIFQTDQIERFQEKLKEQERTLANQRKSYEQALQQAFANIAVKENEVLEKAIEQFDVERILTILNETINLEEHSLAETKETILLLQKDVKLQEQLIGWIEQKEQYSGEKEILDEQKEEIVRKEAALQDHIKAEKVATAEQSVKEAAAQLQKQQNELTRLKTKESDLSEKSKEAAENLAAAKKAMEQLQTLRDEIVELKEQLKLMGLIKEKEELIQTQHQKTKETDQQLAELEKELETSTEEMQKIEATLELIAELRQTMQELQNSMTQLTEDLHKGERRKEQLESICALQKEESTMREDCEEAKAAQKSAYLELVQAKQAYYTDLASQLAAELEADEPCPVCGSTHHPAVAVAQKPTVTKETLEELEHKEKTRQTHYTQIEAALKHCSEDIESHCKSLNIEPQEAESAYANSLEEEKAIQAELKKQKKEADKAKKQIAEEAELKAQLETVRQNEYQTKAAIQKAQSEHGFAVSRIKELFEEKEEMTEKVQYDAEPVIQSALKTKEQRIQTIEKDYETAQQSVNQLSNEQSAAAAAIETTKKQITETEAQLSQKQEMFEQVREDSQLGEAFSAYVLEQSVQSAYKAAVESYQQAAVINQDRLKQVEEQLATVDDLQALEVYQESLHSAEEQMKELEAKRDEWLTAYVQNKKAKETIQLYQGQSAEVEERYQLIGELSRLANGTKETDYISFERYVLGIYFEEILLAANQRFSQMTNHRYELQRQIERGKGAGKQGLDMEVFDHYTGKKRSVHTLSGGETFKASLALALGLSDVIQNQNGGVSVDTLFVDEGFGTLDSDSLDMAVQTLLDLHQKGRLVGIISHVDELKTRIPAHIVVDKTATGSTAYIQK